MFLIFRNYSDGRMLNFIPEVTKRKIDCEKIRSKLRLKIIAERALVC